MNQAIFAFRRYEDASLTYTGLVSVSETARTEAGGYDTVIAR